MSKNCNDKPQTNALKESGLLNTLNQCLEEVYKVYFQPQNEPLRVHYRFLSSFAGSIIFLLLAIFVIMIKTVRETNKSDTVIEIVRGLKIDAVFATDQIFIISILFISIFAIVFASVITAGYTKHGAVRYFFSGVILPAFTLICVQTSTNFF